MDIRALTLSPCRRATLIHAGVSVVGLYGGTIAHQLDGAYPVLSEVGGDSGTAFTIYNYNSVPNGVYTDPRTGCDFQCVQNHSKDRNR